MADDAHADADAEADADGGEGAAGGAAPAEGHVSRRERRFEVVSTVLLGVAALATAWSGYQAALWDGIQSSNYSQASALRTRSSQHYTEANQDRLADLSLFENWLDAVAAGETELATFYEQRFRDEFQPAFEAWEAERPLTNPDAPTSPLRMPDYKLAAEDEARALSGKAEATFQDGEDANNHSDTYVATTLFFAAVLFFAAISERFSFAPARTTLLALAAVGLIGGIGVMLTQPVTSGG